MNETTKTIPALIVYCSLGARYNCVVTFHRLLSPQLLSRCSMLIHYDYDDVTSDDVTGDAVIGERGLQRFALRSIQAQTDVIDSNGLSSTLGCCRFLYFYVKRCFLLKFISR